MVEHAAPPGLEPLALGVREALGQQGTSCEILEHGPGLLESGSSGFRDGAQGRGRARPAQPGEWVAQELGSLLLVVSERGKGQDERDRLPRRQAVRLDRADEPLLVLSRDLRQRGRDRRAERPHVEAALHRSRELECERESVLDPPRPAAQETRYRRAPDPRSLDQRLDDARLVHDRDRAPGGIGRENERHELLRRAAPLDDHGDLRAPLGAPALEPLEAVDDLEEAVLAFGGAERKIHEVSLLQPWDRAAEPGEARP